MPMPDHCFLDDTAQDQDILIEPVSAAGLWQWLEGAPKAAQAWVKAAGFEAKAGSFLALPHADGAIERVLVGLGAEEAPKGLAWLAAVARRLPVGRYRLPDTLPAEAVEAAALGWCLELYQFDRYKSKMDAGETVLVLKDASVVANMRRMVQASALIRDLVNTPTQDMGPAHLQDVAEGLAERFGATIATICGDDLMDENFPAIHAVGRAATPERAPRLIDLTWEGAADGPAVTLVGKGVCFDTGGLDIKPSSGMRWMKKDMGGAAHVLGLAQLIMDSALPVRLRVLIPAVENAISGDAYRPGDVIDTRKGISVEITNTDAEGRVVLCDALTLACEGKPDLLVDYATLTGAARVALGPDLPATYVSDDAFWSTLEAASREMHDPLWRMPLWQAYNEDLSSTVADMVNASEGGFAGSITAALYLQRFVAEDIPWVHFDVFAWSPKAKPARPMGGDAQAMRAMFAAIRSHFSL